MIVGDVRGKGLAAVGESALLPSAFRLVAAQHATLPDPARTLDHNLLAHAGGRLGDDAAVVAIRRTDGAEHRLHGLL
ncbi:hypothetical protein [Kitasatospora sp. DSM 101779]|uniref:hypothetical protein n=1 Tax=Kitasatospora sp. DSM 101779 TaxID=2853165 RepID=UPI00295585B6|nr:hypothetical protein [Kitasatospora sp. DSM 101779]MCU7825952.1 serine/threonine-protein phosphatase [Kitasatospora sp. DSM 101779]